jgi:TPR repeat protein
MLIEYPAYFVTCQVARRLKRMARNANCSRCSVSEDWPRERQKDHKGRGPSGTSREKWFIRYMKSENRFVLKAYKEMTRDNPNLEKSFIWLTKAAEEEEPEALYAIGTWYLHGRYVDKDAKKALSFLIKAAQLNHGSACYDLAVCYEKGVGVRKNNAKAFKYYLEAALKGDKQSIYEVGRCYFLWIWYCEE